MTKELAILQKTLAATSGMTAETFALSIPYWQLKTYNKGEFFNQYKNVCKYLGFVITGIFRVYHSNSETGEEKNMLFFSDEQFVTSYKSFLSQTECNYYTESMESSTILYIHVNDLHMLYETTPAWERFGRIFAESALSILLDNTEGFLFKNPEERYMDMIASHPRLMKTIPLYHIASYLGIQGPSLSRIRKRLGHAKYVK